MASQTRALTPTTLSRNALRATAMAQGDENEEMPPGSGIPMPQNPTMTNTRRSSDPSPSAPALLEPFDMTMNIKPLTPYSANMLRPPTPAELHDNRKLLSSYASTLKSPSTSDDTYTPSSASEKPKSIPRSEVLVPRPLRPLKEMRYFRWRIFLLSVLTVVGLPMWQLIAESASGGTRVAETCDYVKADSMERLFMIDIHVLSGLKFSHAKLLDAAWDFLVGQIGRILHGWLFYHVALRVLTWISEHFSAPYEFQLRVRFDTISIGSLRAAANAAISRSKKSARVYTVFLWFFLSVVYVLLFPTIWGTATGYYQPSTIGYSISEYGPGVLRPNDFKLCWVGNMDKVIGNHSGIVTGPGLNGPSIAMGDPASLAGEPMSEEFRSLLAYETTKLDILSFYGGQIPESDSVVGGEVDWLYCDPFIDEYSGSQFSGCEPEGLFYSAMNGWQYSIQEQRNAQNNLTPFPVDKYNISDQHLYKTEDKENVLNNTIAKFVFDSKAASSDPSIVPYNSSMWWGGETLPISAPFLEFGTTQDGIKCSAETNAGGIFNDLCICLDEEPVAWDILSQLTPETGNVLCVSGQAYVWGFAVRIALIGALCETIWISSCAIMWIISTDSILISHRRPYAGIVRNVLDMATVLRNDLGTNTGTYGEKELIRELRKCQPVGYVLEDDEPSSGATRIKMDSVPTGMRKRRYMHVDQKAHYS